MLHACDEKFDDTESWNFFSFWGELNKAQVKKKDKGHENQTSALTQEHLETSSGIERRIFHKITPN